MLSITEIGLIRIPGRVWDECFFRAKARLMRGKTKKHSCKDMKKVTLVCSI